MEGAAALEFALVLPLFSLLLLGSIDFGHLFFVKSVISNAARQGARVGAVQTDPTLQKSEAEKAANNYLTAAGLGTGCKLDCPTAVGTAAVDAATPNVVVVVKVAGQFKNISGFGYQILPGFTNPFATINDLSATSQMRWESLP